MLPLRALGLRLHRRRRQRRSGQAAPTSVSRSSAPAPPAIQLVPILGRDAKQLYVFQRTPSTVDERGNTPTDPQWVDVAAAGLAGGAQAQLPPLAPFEGMAVFGEPDLVCDFWTELGRNTAARIAAADDPASLTIEQIMAIREEEDYKVMERLRRRVDDLVEDAGDRRSAQAVLPVPVQAALLQRRLPADFNRPNVTLVDVSRIQGRGTDHREGDRRQRRRVRGRLHHLRQRFRDHHRDQPPLRDRRDRGPRRPVAVRSLARQATRRCTG